MTPSLLGRNLIRTGAFAAATLALATVAGAYDVPISPDLAPNSTKENWISLSVGSFNASGSASSLQRVRQHEDAGFGGIDSLRYRKSLEGGRLLKIDGKAIFGDNEFYLGAILEDEANGWYVGAGFRESRVFYSGTGGYSPFGLWIQPHDDQLFTDRGEYWVEAGVTKGAWTFKIRGSRSYRKGQKDSTMWGDSIYSGLGTASRKTVPALLDIDETRDTIAIDVGYEAERMDAGAGLRFETIEANNTAILLRNPGQANPTGSGQRYQVTRSGSDSDLFSGHAYIVSRIGDRLILSGAGSTTSLDTVLSGNRIFGATRDAAYNPAFPRAGTAHGYNDLDGDTQWDQWVLVGNAVFIPAKNWTINGGLRYENQTQDSFTHFIETAGPASNPLEEPFEQGGEREFDEVLATLEANYTGIDNVVITPFAEYAVGEGSLVESQLEGHAAPMLVLIDRDTHYDRDYVKYGINARWYPSTGLNFATGIFRKERDNSYTTIVDNTPPVGGNRYPAFINDQNFTTDDIYLKASFRPVSNLALTARWDRVSTEIESTEDNLAAVIAAEQDMDIYSVTLTWSATSNVALQVGANFVTDDMVTGTVSANSAVAPSIGRFASDYTTYNALVMIAIDEAADLQLDFYSFDAGNYVPISASTLPYGLDSQERTYGVTYTRKLSADLSFSLRYVYSDYKESSAGGFKDFESNMIYGRMQMRF